mmetsp:Transcript_31282/g.73727  ORF Transcript_31282/g.73727 Transcript_31282/m.73727 type:complete len:498 (+) Transcript_31282:64-1557(+)
MVVRGVSVCALCVALLLCCCVMVSSFSLSAVPSACLGPHRASVCVQRNSVGVQGGRTHQSSVVGLRAAADDVSDAEKEAAKWEEMAKKMDKQRGAKSAGGSSESSVIKSSLGVSDLRELEGKKLPAPESGELEGLMARAEAFKAQQQQQEKGVPAELRGARSTGKNAPQRLVGGDAGSLRQAAPFQPGDSKAGNVQEGWTEDQLQDILDEEAKWKEQLAQKQQLEVDANALANDAARFKIGAGMQPEKGVPSSMEGAVVQALLSSVSVMQRGCGRFRIDVDTTEGDETYTTLKNSVPFTRVFCKGLAVNGLANIRIVFPDVGASALANRDWAKDDGFIVTAFDRQGPPKIEETDDAVVVIAPASSELEPLKKLADTCGEQGLPLILINPSVKSPGGENLGALGLYSLGLSEFLASFESAYYLRALPWGCVLRAFPARWGVYELGPRGAYNKLQELNSMPNGEKLEEIFYAANPDQQLDGIDAVAQGFKRFLDNYSKG